MIFVYSSTGNSLQLAEAIADRLSDDVTDILDVPDGVVDATSYDRIGFVAPVYYFNIPLIMREFVDRMKVREGQKVFMVFTCGSIPDHVCGKAKKFFSKRGMDLTHVFTYVMPENYIAVFPPLDDATRDRVLARVPRYVSEVVDALNGPPVEISSKKGAFGLLTLFGDTAYDLMRKTKGFRVDDGCTSCGLCARVCPDSAIEIGDSGPVWVKRKCWHCMACINRCPQSVIQYKRRTEKRARYVNPYVELR